MGVRLLRESSGLIDHARAGWTGAREGKHGNRERSSEWFIHHWW
jgi:hypothetical protein